MSSPIIITSPVSTATTTIFRLAGLAFLLPFKLPWLHLGLLLSFKLSRLRLGLLLSFKLSWLCLGLLLSFLLRN